jgi:hypothetical protein
MVSIDTDETPKQTSRIMDLTAKEALGKTVADTQPLIQRHHAVQRMLRRRDVVIPYAAWLSERIPDTRVEARRAFPHLLSMVTSSVLLHQYQRGEDGDGSLIAEIDDYALAYELMLAPLGRLLGTGLTPATQRFFRRLKKWAKTGEFTSTEARCKEKVSKPAVWGWLRELTDAGFVQVIERGHGNSPSSYRIVHGRQLKDDSFLLPSADEMSRAFRG